MDIEKLIEQLKARGLSNGSSLGYHCGLFDDAATALSTLQTENEKLKDQLYDGEGTNLVEYWMQQAKIEENGHRNCQAENEKLRAELEQERDHRLYAEEHADLFLEDCKRLNVELERVKDERDAAVERIREWEKFDTYLLIHNFITPEKWRGQKED